MKKNKMLILIAAAVLALLPFLLCSCPWMGIDNYPAKYKEWQWVPISFDEAKTAWASYDMSSSPDTLIDVWRSDYVETTEYTACKVGKKKDGKFYVKVGAFDLPMTVDIDAENSLGARFERAKRDSSFIRICGGTHDFVVLKNGWLKERRDEDTAVGFEYFFLEY